MVSGIWKIPLLSHPYLLSFICILLMSLCNVLKVLILKKEKKKKEHAHPEKLSIL